MRALLALLLTAWSALASCVPPPNTYDYEAQGWQTRAPAITGTDYRAGTVFMQQSKWWGIRPLLGRVNLYVGPTTNEMTVCIITNWSSTSPIADLLSGFTAADYNETNGLTGNLTTTWLTPNGGFGLNLVSFTAATNLHMAAYVRSGGVGSAHVICMGQSSSGGGGYLLAVSYDFTTYLQLGTNFTSVAETNGVGFYATTRRSTTDAALYKNGTNLVSLAGTDNDVLTSTSAVQVHAYNNNGLPVNNTSQTLSYYAFGFAIPDALAATYNKLVQNAQIPFNRQK